MKESDDLTTNYKEKYSCRFDLRSKKKKVSYLEVGTKQTHRKFKRTLYKSQPAQKKWNGVGGVEYFIDNTFIATIALAVSV